MCVLDPSAFTLGGGTRHKAKRPEGLLARLSMGSVAASSPSKNSATSIKSSPIKVGTFGLLHGRPIALILYGVVVNCIGDLTSNELQCMWAVGSGAACCNGDKMSWISAKGSNTYVSLLWVLLAPFQSQCNNQPCQKVPREMYDGD